ncbi:MAG: 50S ribosomal protein L25, partial [Calditrichaeota bacterium]
MAEFNLKAFAREETGKKVAKKLRRQGKIPAVYYFRGQEAKPLVVDVKNLSSILSSEASVVDLEMEDGQMLPSIIREIQWDPITSEPIHVDFFGVKLDEKVVVEVPVHLVGTANGVKNQGGVLQFLARTVEIECLPREIPEHIEVDISDLNVHDSITVGDLAKQNYEVVSDPDTVIASIIPPR